MNKRNRPRLILVIASLAFFLCQGAMCPEKKDDKSVQPVTRPPTIVAAGGHGINGRGGDGGVVEIHNRETVMEFHSEKVSPPVAPQSKEADGPGPDAWIVDHDYTVMAYDCDGGPSPQLDEYFLCLDADPGYILHMTSGGTVEIDGVIVEQGAVLTLALNKDTGGEAGYDSANVFLPDGIEVNGVLTTMSLATGGIGGATVETIDGAPATSRDKGNLHMAAGTLEVNGAIDLSGIDGAEPGQRGGFGGSLFLYNYIMSQPRMVTGAVNTSGGKGAQGGCGGDGGSVYMDGLYMFTNKGNFLMRGGEGDSGGSGGDFFLGDSIAGFINLGILDVSGGYGREGNGGNAGSVTANTFKNFGDLTANGGDASTSGAVAVSGGNGGSIELDWYGLTVSGRVSADGGNAHVLGTGGQGGTLLCHGIYWYLISDAAVSARGGSGEGSGMAGGNGGWVEYAFTTEFNYWLTGPMSISGSVDVSGGDGDIGGNGGTVTVPERTYGFNLEFAGMGPIDLDGGPGADGGDGGQLLLSGGIVLAEVPVYSRGGAGSAVSGTGGDGGDIVVISENPPSFLDPRYEVSGGSATTPGAEGTVILDGVTVYP